VTLPPGKYRFELADPVESRRVIKVTNEDGSKQLALLLTMVVFTRRVARATYAEVEGKPGDVSVESFQRAAFNS